MGTLGFFTPRLVETSRIQSRVPGAFWVTPQVDHSRPPAGSDMMSSWPIVGGGFFGGLASSGPSS